MKPLALAAVTAATLLLGAGRADAASFLGSLDPSATPDGWACEACPAGETMGFRQFALRGAIVETPEDGVLVSADVFAKRLSGIESPRIAVLRPDRDGVNLEVVDSAPITVTSAEGELVQAGDLHLAVERGDAVGLLFRAGEVDLGVRERPRPDGAVQWFTTPCDPCGSDGGTGVELLFDATVEPDVDTDGMGDETQDDDGGGLGFDWVDDWFADYDAGDELDAPAPRVAPDARPARPRPPQRAAHRPEGRAGERLGHAARQPPDRRGPVHDHPHRRGPRAPRRARPCAPHLDRRGEAAQAPADQGRRRLLPPPIDPGTPHALRSSVIPGWTSRISTP